MSALGPSFRDHDCDERGCHDNPHIAAFFHGLSDAQLVAVRAAEEETSGLRAGELRNEKDRLPATHYADEDRDLAPFCRGGREGDLMTFFLHETTCTACLRLLDAVHDAI